MIRFAWLQSRAQTAIAYAVLAVVAVAALVTGIQLSHVYTSLVAHCTSDCGLATQQYLSHDSFMDKTLDVLARAAPALVGLFWGAPLLAREFETGTYRFAWTQSVPRLRWLLVRIGVGALATLTVAALFSLTVTWWYRGRDRVGANIYEVFDRRDIAPIGYALFAFAAGVLFGALIRRTVPAMAATLAVFVFARVAVDPWVRPHLLAAEHAVVTLARPGPVQLGIGSSNGGAVQIFAQGGGPPNSWTVASHFVTRSDHPVSAAQMTAFVREHCPTFLGPGSVHGAAKVPAGDPAAACLTAVSKAFRLAVSYQPAGRYWAFQWLESAVFVVLGVAAVGMTCWLVMRRGR